MQVAGWVGSVSCGSGGGEWVGSGFECVKYGCWVSEEAVKSGELTELMMCFP